MVIYFYYKSCEKSNYVVLNSASMEIEYVKNLPRDSHVYQMLWSYDKELREKNKDYPLVKPKDLYRYKTDFEASCKKIKEFSNFDVVQSYNNEYVVYGYFLWNTAKIKLDQATIDITESDWMDRTYNAGSQYIGTPGEYKSYGYDYEGMYSHHIASDTFMFPTKGGKEAQLLEIELVKIPKKRSQLKCKFSDGTVSEDLPFGFYNIVISSNHKNMPKCFSFCKEHTYTNTCVHFAFAYQKKFDIKIEIVKSEANCYIYNNKYLVKGSSIFKNWHKNHLKLRAKYPKDKLVKHLSMIWGHLAAKNTMKIKPEDEDKYNIVIQKDQKGDYRELQYNDSYCTCLNLAQPSKYNFRIKPFLTSYCRSIMANLIIHNSGPKGIDNVIRVHTDGVVYTNIDPELFKNPKNKGIYPEEKTTGRILWKNVNVYKKI